MSSLSFMGRRRWAALAATLVAALALLALPPVRAAADQLLQVFRVRTVVFIPVSEDRIRQLESLDFDENTLFIAEPEVVNTPAEPRTFATAEEAAAAAGLAALEQPTDLPAPPTSVEFTVTDRTVSQFQVNVEAARQLLALVGVSDVTLPDALGTQPITIDLAPVVMARYEGPGYSIELVQGHSPDVTLPDGVDLAQLGRAALRLLGMAPDQADALSQQIDWNSTLVFPFPANLDTIRQVSINGAPGLLVSGEAGRDDASQLYWQRGDRFFVLMAEGSGRDERALGELLRAAESVR